MKEPPQHRSGGGGGCGETAVAAAASRQQEAAACEECRQKPSKYRCPACSIRTCSLPCVNAHKKRTSCSGKRDRTQFLPLSGFNDSVLISDYRVLEEAKRVAESSQRTRAQLCPYPAYHLPYYLRGLRSAAASRRTKILFLPSGMSRRNRNKSRYDQRRRLISWTIEWRFHSTDVILYDHGIPENANLRSVIEKHLQLGPWNHQLKQFCETQLDHLKFCIRKHHKGPKSLFRELDIEAPIRQELADAVILEYPVIHVFLPMHSCDFEISKYARPVTLFKDTGVSDYQPMQGVCFREEEIEEDGRLEPRIHDSAKHQNGDQVNRACHTEFASDGLSPVRDPNGISSSMCPVIKGSGAQDEMGYDFDLGLMDVYSDLIAQMNPDDFLDLDDEYDCKVEVFSTVDEVEEGEILE